MAVYVDMNSCLGKAASAIGAGGSAHGRFTGKMDEAMLGNVKLEFKKGGLQHTPEEAAAAFIEVLRSEIAGSGLSAGAIAKISDISAGGVQEVGYGKYSIGISFSNVSSPSLAPETYGGIESLAQLFNNGVDHTMRPVHATHFGQDFWSRTVIPGTHFVQSAIGAFMGGAAAAYGVESIQIVGNYS